MLKQVFVLGLFVTSAAGLSCRVWSQELVWSGPRDDQGDLKFSHRFPQVNPLDCFATDGLVLREAARSIEIRACLSVGGS